MKKNYVFSDGKRIRKSTGKSSIGEAWEFADFFDWERSDWIRRQHAKGRAFSKATVQMRAIHLENHILPEFGDRPLTQINRVDVENWLIGIDLSNQTKNHILYTFRIILRDAEAAGKLDSNPL